MTLYLFLDTETTGLNYETGNSKPRENKMLQLAYKLYDANVKNELASGNFFVKYSQNELKDIQKSMNDYVFNMHSSTGLLDNLTKDTTSVEEIDKHLFELLNQYPEHKFLLAGNNVQFDYEVVRRHLPLTSSKLYHSVLDVSSVRRAFSTFGSDFGEKTKAEKLSNHDALVDIEECVKEFRKYQQVLAIGTVFNNMNKDYI